MLAERTDALLANQEKWKEKTLNQNRRSSDINVAKNSSLQARKSALLQASGGWKCRVQTDESINSLNASYRLQCSQQSTPKTPLSSRSDAKQDRFFSSSESRVKELASRAFIIRPKKEACEQKCNEDMEKGDATGGIERQSPVLHAIRRPQLPNRRPPSSVKSALEDLSVDTSVPMATSAKRSSTCDKENNDDYKEPPAKQPFSPNEERTPKLGLKNCGIALKKPDLKRPYPDVMLIRCKGLKHVDVRLVAPRSTSVHECASFVLVTSTKLLIFEGEFSTLIEKAKAKQIAHSVISSRDLSCSATKFELVKEDSRSDAAFWKFLGDKRDSRKIPEELEKFIDPESEDTFEDAAKITNVVYEMDSSGNGNVILRHEIPQSTILNSSKILVFDFGSEIYVWLGHDADRLGSKSAMDFAENLREIPIPHSEIVASEPEGDYSVRPEWILIRKFTEGLPDCLFRLKFLDSLPEPTVKTPKTPKFSTERFILAQKKTGRIAPVPLCGLENLLKDENDLIERLAEKLIDEEPQEHVLELEETLLRPDDKNIFTEGLIFYHLNGEVLDEMDALEEFFDRECYVIKWLYRVEKNGIRKLDGTPGIQKDTGRQRVAYFYWFGKKSSKKSQGSLALAMRKLDKDRREHVLVHDGSQGLLFLNLFDGKMVISSSDSSESDQRVYVVHGSTETYFYAEEIDDLENLQLRPQAAYIFVNTSSKSVSLWSGKLVTKQIAKGANTLADKIAQLHNFSLLSTTSSTFPAAEPFEWRHAPQIFRLFDTEGEQLHSSQFSKAVNFTFRQTDLRDTMIVDQGSCLWVWTETLVTTFHLQVASKYWKTKNRIEKPATVICKGREPTEFKALFPSWSQCYSTLGEEFEPEEPQSLDALLKERTRFRPLEDVRDRKLPRGCDTKNLEKYLIDDDFTKIFKMERNAFYALPKWKQTTLKKDARLF